MEVISKAHADQRFDEFIHRFDTLAGRSVKFHDANSPLYPYRFRPLHEGLSGDDLLSLDKLQLAGDCYPSVLDLMVKGFFGLYPHLKPIKEDRNRYPRVYTGIRNGDPAMLARCVYFKRKRKLDRWFDVIEFEPVSGAFGVKLEGDGVAEPDHFIAWSQWQYLGRTWGRLAFCRNYPPFIRDAWATAGQKGGLSYTLQEATYLVARASALGMLSSTELSAAIKSLQHDGASLADIRRLMEQSRSGGLHEMGAVPGHWQLVCREWIDQEIKSRKSLNKPGKLPD